MAELSSQFASISPGMDTETATDDLVSTMQAFGIATEEVERKVMDNINAIGNSMATTNAEIGEMLKRSSAAMKAANNSLEQTVALESAAVQITRNAETTGTAFRTISMRIRGYSEESEDGLEEVDEELKNISGDIADLTKINGKGGISIFTDESRNEYKSTYQILKEISEIWKDLTDAQQAALLEKLAGKRGGQVLAGILADFSSVDEAMKTMENAAGSADKEMDIIRDSIEYKLNAIKQQWVGTLTDIAGRDEIKGVLDFVLNLSEGLGGIISDLGVLKTAIIGLVTVVGSRRLGLFDTANNKTLIGGIVEMRNNRRVAAEKRQGLQHALDIYNPENGGNPDDFLQTEDFSQIADDLKPVESILVNIRKQAEETGATGEEALGMVEEALNEVEVEGSHLGEVFKNIGKTLINGLASAAITTAITMAISGLSSLFDSLVMTEEEAENLASKFRDSFDSMKKEQSESAKTFKELDNEFKTLSRGVNALGENVGLTEDEFSRYNEITAIIADKMPELIQGYTDLGTPIINLTEDVNSLTEAYKKNQQEAARTLYYTVDEEDGSYIEGVFTSAKNRIGDRNYEEEKQLYEQMHPHQTYYMNPDDFVYLSATERKRIYEEAAKIGYEQALQEADSGSYIADLLSEAGFEKSAQTATRSLIDKYGLDIPALDETSVREFDKTVHNKLLKQSADFNAKLQQSASDIKKAGQNYLDTLDEYYDLGTEIKSYINAAISNADFDTLYSQGLFDDTGEQMEQYVFDTLQMFQKLKDDTQSMSKIKLRLNLVTQLNNGDITFSEYQDTIQRINQWVETLDPETQRTIKILFQLDTESDKIKEEIDHLKLLMGDNYSEDFLNGLTREQLTAAMNIAPRVKDELKSISDDKLNAMMLLTPKLVLNPFSVDEITKEIEEKVEPTIEITPKVKADDTVESLNKLQTAIGSLKDLYDQTVNMEHTNDDPNTFGFADPAMLSSIKSSFSDFVESLDDEEKTETLAIAFNEFEETLLKFPNNASKAQDAMNKLLTAYIDQTDIIQNLDEETADYAIQWLKSMKIENAEAIVMNRLNKNTKSLMKNMSGLADAYRDLESVKEKGLSLNNDKDGEYEKTSAKVSDALKKMYSFTKDGNTVFSPTFNKEWIAQHSDMINQAVSEDVEAINKLNAEAAKHIVAQTDVKGDTYNAIRNQIDAAIDEYTKHADQYNVGDSVENDPLIKKLRGYLGTADEVGKITEEEMEAILNALQIELDEGVAKVKTTLTEVSYLPEILNTQVKASDMVNDVADIEAAVASLSDVYDQIIKLPKDADQNAKDAFGFVDPSAINAVESAFQNLIKTVDDESSRQILSTALEDFENTLLQFPGDADKAQESMDKLITAYIDQSYYIKNLTEENKEWVKQRLKAIGITNAEEVVESRLNKTNKKLIEGTKKLSNVFRDNSEALLDVNKGTEKWKKAIGSIDKETGKATGLVEQVRDMFTITLENGKQFIPDVDTDFVVENLDLIRQVAEGDAEAIDELREKLNQQLLVNIHINGGTPEDIKTLQSWVENAQAEIGDIEIGTYVDETPFDSALNNMIRGLEAWVNAGMISADDMNNILASVGVVPEVQDDAAQAHIRISKDQQNQIAKAVLANGGSTQDAIAAIQSASASISVPSIRYKVVSGISNTNAHYSAPRSNNNNNSGGSPSGSNGSEDKLTEDTKETYDWIEVKLQRLEEAYERLDKVSGAVYKSWEKRNNATIDQLANIDEQIEATATAAKHYKDYAFNKVTVEAPKKEDYEDNTKQYEYDQKQYDEYKSRKTEIRDKIINGLIGEKDIEEIGNKYIKEYYDQFSSWYEKYVENNDKLSDLEERRYNKHRELFDNIKTEFDGILGLFEAEGDAVDKLIERTEEHGYFVSEKYYDKKKVLIQDQIDTETQRLHDLAKARDAAVASGSIKEGSEAWNDMTKEIKDGENEINGLYTELIKLDNEQRQLRWDGFDYAIEKLDKMNEETEFLIDLLDNEDLFNFEYDDRNHKTYDGTMSDRGWAAAGLHASQYNKELLKSKYAAEELAKVEEELATEKGKNDKNLIARREELLGLQRESIQAAEAEKEAIKDLVEEGIFNAPPFSNERWYFI